MGKQKKETKGNKAKRETKPEIGGRVKKGNSPSEIRGSCFGEFLNRDVAGRVFSRSSEEHMSTAAGCVRGSERHCHIQVPYFRALISPVQRCHSIGVGRPVGLI
jgi:hypothetical protein